MCGARERGKTLYDLCGILLVKQIDGEKAVVRREGYWRAGDEVEKVRDILHLHERHLRRLEANLLVTDMVG